MSERTIANNATIGSPDQSAARILVVEDEAIVAYDLSRRLTRMGYEVVGTADNGADALALAEREQPTFVFMDIVIQGPRDGVDTAIELTRRWDVPVVFLTAHADPDTVRRTRDAAPYGYLLKPFEDRELRTAIEIASHRHRLEAEARILRQAFTSSATGVAVVDARRDVATILSCNTALESLTGHSDTELVGRPIWWLLAGDDGPGRGALEAAARNHAHGRATALVARRDGTSFWAEVALNPVANRSGAVTHQLWSVHDVSARKRAEEALVHAQKMEAVGRFTGGIAHDFNNILSVILTCAELAHEALPEEHPARHEITEVLRAADRASALTRQLLSFSRRSPASRRPVELNAQVSAFLPLIERSVGDAVEVVVSPSASRVVVSIDPVQLDQVLLNLAVNARDAMPAGGTLRIAVSTPDEGVGRIEFRDTGCGMDEETRRKVFQHFFTTKPVGTGLGLATCAAIVEDAGGTIRVASSPGEGATFTIDLPVTSDLVASAPSRAPSDVPPRGERLLLVDDDAPLLRATARMLTEAGYEVVTARDGHEAVEMLRRHGQTLDAVITDVNMPGLRGFDVVRHARELAPEAGALFLTGYLTEADRERVADAPLLWKPFTRVGLRAAVTRVSRRTR